MSDENPFPFTRKLIEDDDLDEAGTLYRDGEDLRRGYSLLRELAAHDVTLVEIAPGVWRHSKLPDDGKP